MLLAYRCGIASPHVQATAIEATEFTVDADRHGVHAVPAIVIDGRHRYAGAVPEHVFVRRLLDAVAPEEQATPPDGRRPQGAIRPGRTTLGS